MTAVHIIVGGAVGLLLAMVAGVIYTVAVGGIEKGDPDEYVVAGILMAGIAAGLIVGWRLA